MSSLTEILKRPFKTGYSGSNSTATRTEKEVQQNTSFKTDEEIIVTSRQNKIVLNHLRSGREINQIDAAKMYGVWRLGARIWDLRKAGHNISTTMLNMGNRRIALYKLNSN